MLNIIKNITFTLNEIAAGGPIPQNYTLAQQEQKCITEQKNPPWYQTMNAFERGDSNRTGLYGCATFTGSFTGPNSVMHIDLQTYTTPSPPPSWLHAELTRCIFTVERNSTVTHFQLQPIYLVLNLVQSRSVFVQF